jgi:hypothetical protein
MLGKEFRGLAEAVTRTYGDDPWFFLRELAQNSRDAGASNIWVTAETTPPGIETLTFADDGSGMTLAHARRFLFRLYASDKAGDPSAAGRYGIGFWTILRFQPMTIRLQSRRGDHSWAVTLDGEFTIRQASCQLTRSGTAVSLTRPASFSSAGEFASQLESGLRTYCRYLRRNDRRGSMLPLWYAGKNLTEPMALPGPLSLSFRSNPVEGAVGLGEKPRVSLYARGLPVWQGAVLDQMSHLQAATEARNEIGSGLAPVFLLNGNHLDVTFSRNLALENRALDRVRKKAAAALRRLLEASLDRTYPRKWHQRLHDRAQSVGERAKAASERLRIPGWRWLPLSLLLLVPLELLLLRACPTARFTAKPSWFSLGASSSSYRGASIEISSSTADMPFSYWPVKPAFFRLFAADAYDPRSGFVRKADEGRWPLTVSPACPEAEILSMRLRTDSGGETILPLAPGHVVRPGSLRLNGRHAGSAVTTRQGETILAVPPGGGTIEYQSCPQGATTEMSASEISILTRLPHGLSLPADMETALLGTGSATLIEKVERARAMARQALVYDASPAAYERYRQEAHIESWLARVLRVGGGDCDILNGFNVLLLRKLGVPSRLVIGMVGERGRARPQLHAWGEYFDHGWAVSDVTSSIPAGAAGLDFKELSGPIYTPGPLQAGSRQNGLPAFTPLLGLFLGLLLLAAAGGLLILRGRNRDNGAFLLPKEQMEKALMQLIQHALRQPSLWGMDNPLWRHRLLPTVSGGAISIDRANRLQRRNKLFMTANLNPLALAMAASRITVLDLSRPLHAPLRHLLAGAVDSDLLCQLRPEPPAPGNGLLAAVNGLLCGRLRHPPPCLLSPGLNGADLLRISLPSSLRNPPFFFPRRFVAVNPQGSAFAHSAALFQNNQALAIYSFVQRLQAEHLLDGAAGTVILKRTARRLLRHADG